MKKNIFILGLASILLVNCSDNESESVDTQALTNKEILTNTAVNVITATYKELYDNSVILTTACQNLTIGDETELTAVKNAWASTRAPWEKSEGFLYGPVDTEGIDPAIDSWPVDVNAINNILNSSQAITSTLLDNDDARGFHTIEYFVWGLNGNKTASQLTTRELEYLVAATQNLQSKTQQLYNGWLQSQGNFANNFINAGQSGTIYTSQKNALLELVEGIIIISDEVATGKIETPLNGNSGAASPQDEESRFSNNSKLDFANNIRSIQNIYLGDYGTTQGKGLSDLVASKNATLDATIKTKISDAITSIEAIPGTFTDAIFNNRTAVQNAQQKVAELKVTLESQLQPLISNL
ncbi:imelysin [Flavobacterium sp. F372]|jgi:putative iron-regulated protein|uniref:Imelysin n=1 Tax=Flavobacterium bernardetii TaxID=2813823 RepID=A0ABR7J2X6_9FLAO|nr:imelysin family protein [Flavobacterium bernardetii]MBC5836194.1 imelysin [Flavobacterium bernardetii]NHF71420.1 imelysin [Flavobacterium bernardetii]